MRGLALVSLLLAACGTAPAGGTTAGPGTSVSAPRTTTPSIAPSVIPTANSQGPFAVAFGSGLGGQFLTVVGTDGRLYGQVSPRNRTGDWGFQPSVSTSNSAVYYLDGDSALMRLRPGGSPEHVRDLPGTPSVHAAFAVSPDDSRIAIALLTYGPTPAGPGVAKANYIGMTLYVEDLDGSHHVDLFSSPTIAEWPVGWHGSDLVIAVSLAQIPGLGLDPHPYYAFAGIHVADASTGTRKASLCNGSAVLGLATAAGVLCAAPDGTVESDWSGNVTPTGLQCSSAELQPGGASIACAAFGETPFLWSAGSKHTLPAPPLCWVGANDLILDSPQTGALLYHVASGTTQQIQALATWTVGAIPGGV